MALRESALRVAFRGGVDTKSDPLTVPATQLLALENGVFERAGSIRKRNGYEELAGLQGAIRTATRGDELLAFTPNRCLSRQNAADRWGDTGPVFSAVGSDRPLVSTGTQQLAPDQATSAEVTVAAWEDSRGGVWWSVLDVTGHVLRAPAQADANGQTPRCVACGRNLHIYYAVPAQRRLMVIVVDPAAPSSPLGPRILIDDLDATTPVYDACPTPRPHAPAVLAWHEGGTGNLRIAYVDQSGVLAGPATGDPSVTRASVAIAASSPLAIAYGVTSDGRFDFIALGYVSGSGGKIHHIKGDFSPVESSDGDEAIPVTVHSAVGVQRIAIACKARGRFDFTTSTAWEESASQPSNCLVECVRSSFNDATPDGDRAAITIRSVGLASRAFTIDEDVLAVFFHDTTFFNTYLTLRLSDGLAVGRHVPGSAAGAPPRHHLPSAHVTRDSVSVALPVRDRLISENGDKFTVTSIRSVSLDFDNPASHQTAQLGRGLYMAGACPMHYDGRIWTELGFHFGPELITAVAATGGSLTPMTTYEYRCWYESTDAQGEVHLGPTSIGTLIVMAAGQTQVTLTLPTLRVTGKNNVRIGVARSLAGKTGNAAQLFRASSLDPGTAGAPNGYVANDPTTNTVTFVDRMGDATLATFDELYTDGGILSNDPAPIGSTIARGKSRLFATDPSDGNLIRYSQTLDDGYGVEWPPELTVRVDPFGGDVTALAVQDDRVIVFKRNAIFMFAGDGPLPNGDSSTSGFTTPQLLTSDIGCIEPASIVLTPNGHMFKSAKGIQMLAGDTVVREQHESFGSLAYVGSAVEAFNSQRIRRGTVMPDRTQVVFLTDAGQTLLYDYLFGQWSTFTNHEGLDAAVVNNAYHYLRKDGRVFRETPGKFSDAGTRIRLRFETAWIHMQEHLQGFAKFFEMFLLGTWISPHQLGVQYRTDYTPQWNDSVWLDATGLLSNEGWITGSGAAVVGVEPISGTSYGDGSFGDGPFGGTPPDLYQWRLDLYETGQSIQFRIQDFEADGFAGASFELTELLLTGGVERNAPKPFSAARST